MFARRFPAVGCLLPQRLLAWTAAAFALGAVACAVMLVRGWIADHPLGLPMGLPETIAASGWLAVIALVFAIASLVTGLRAWRRGTVPRLTQAGRVDHDGVGGGDPGLASTA